MCILKEYLRLCGGMMKKIVYFDEESALDWLDQRNDGRLEEINKEIIKKGKNFLADAELNAEGGINQFLNLLRFKGKGRMKGDYSREGTTVIEKTVTNTILTTFTDYIDPKNENSYADEIEKISNFKLSLVNNSFTFVKIITPVFKLFPNQIRIDDNNLNQMNIDSLDLTNFEEVIDSLKGYFEFKAFNNNNDEEKIVRFNSNSLRNNYRLTDFLSMDLVMYGVRVGVVDDSLKQFDIGNLFAEDKNQSNKSIAEPSLDEFDDEKSKEKNSYFNKDQLEIIDIILAGVD